MALYKFGSALFSSVADLTGFLWECVSPAKTVTLDHHHVKLLRVLGEGAFAYVHLAEDEHGQQYALKSMLVQSAEQREVRLYCSLMCQSVRLLLWSLFVIRLHYRSCGFSERCNTRMW